MDPGPGCRRVAEATPRQRADCRRGALLVEKSRGVLKGPRRTYIRKVSAACLAFGTTLARPLWQLGLPAGTRVRVWAVDEHRYGLISHFRRCRGLRRVRPHVPCRTRCEWGYGATALETAGRDEAHGAFLPGVSKEYSTCFLEEIIRAATARRAFPDLESMESAIENEWRPLWTTPERVRSLVGDGWNRA